MSASGLSPTFIERISKIVAESKSEPRGSSNFHPGYTGMEQVFTERLLTIIRIGAKTVCQRLSWCAVERRVCLGKTHRAGRSLAASSPVVDPLERRGECQEHCDYCREPEEYESSPVVSPLVTQRILPLKVKNNDQRAGRFLRSVAHSASARLIPIEVWPNIGSTLAAS
jgi:sulfatase maturation enzyme AslB (radical SAM superfamily)